jgi:beta-ureidopropionase / N-carbamoyl-L-amino-acid hydrolase
MPKIDGKRLLADLNRIRDFGRYKTGVHRPHLSPQDVESRRWLSDRIREAGLEPVIDGVGSVFGRSSRPGAKLLVGSHSDTQPNGGWLDGVMGVIYGLELARAFNEDAQARALGVIEPVSWADEESAYLSFLGSRSYIGEIVDAEISGARSRDDGTPLTEALERAGFAGRPRIQFEPGRHKAYLEAHIEQGGVLEHEKKRIGVVTTIVGSHQYRIVFEGQQNHAGTTPMRLRRDAGVALTRLCTDIETRFAAIAGPHTVWTTGKIQLTPGVPSIVPGEAEMLFQYRDPDPNILTRFSDALVELVAEASRRGPCRITVERRSRSTPMAMDAAVQDALEAAARRHVKDGWRRMHSGAGHDAQIVAKKLRAGMLFIPSIGGVSHHWSEDTAAEDIVLGAQVLADAAETILRN